MTAILSTGWMLSPGSGSGGGATRTDLVRHAPALPACRLDRGPHRRAARPGAGDRVGPEQRPERPLYARLPRRQRGAGPDRGRGTLADRHGAVAADSKPARVGVVLSLSPSIQPSRPRTAAVSGAPSPRRPRTTASMA